MGRLKIIALLLCTFLPSGLRIAVWRMLGMRVGNGCRVSVGSIVVADRIKLDHGAVIEPLTFIYRPKVFEMGERARIAAFVRVVGYGEVVIGPQSFVAMACMIDCTTEFRMGHRVALGPRGKF